VGTRAADAPQLQRALATQEEEEGGVHQSARRSGASAGASAKRGSAEKELLCQPTEDWSEEEVPEDAPTKDSEVAVGSKQEGTGGRDGQLG